MKHVASPTYWACFRKLPPKTQILARKNFDILKSNPFHPSLHVKRVRKYWSVRVGLKHRAIGIEIEEGILWFWIGTHADYDKIIN